MDARQLLTPVSYTHLDVYKRQTPDGNPRGKTPEQKGNQTKIKAGDRNLAHTETPRTGPGTRAGSRAGPQSAGSWARRRRSRRAKRACHQTEGQSDKSD